MSKRIKLRTAWQTCRAVLLWLAFLGFVAGCDSGDSGDNTPPDSGNDVADASDASDPADASTSDDPSEPSDSSDAADSGSDDASEPSDISDTSDASDSDDPSDGSDPSDSSDATDPSDVLVDDPSDSPTPVTPAVGCGDWVIQEGEACDAGPRNGLDGAGCRSDCTFPQCGDGQRSPSEECDSDNDEACNVESCELALSLASVQEPTGAVYEVLAPDATTIFGDAMQTLASSEHFVIRASYDDVALMAEHQTPGGPLSEENQLAILGRLEEIWDFYIDELGFAPPYYDSPTPYKVNAVITDYGYLSGGTFQEPAWGPGQHPQIQMHYGATEGYHGMAHEFAHALQNMVSGADWFDYGGWFSESHAEFMAYQFNPDGVGCSEVLVNAPHHHYGTTRNRYCNWQFWDYVTDTLGAAAVNALWSGNINGPTFINPLDVAIPDSCSELDGPFAAFQRNLGWDIERLNDLFGRWALANIEWSYGKGPLFRNAYGDYVGDLEAGKRGRVTRLEAYGEGSDRFYMPPDILAPQRWGYNVVQLFPDEETDEFVVEFRGLVQAESARTAPLGSLNMEPDNSQLPDSGWRWGVVVIGDRGRVSVMPLQSGARASLRVQRQRADIAYFLVVMGAPMSLQQIFWDQVFYSVYRYPWRIKLHGAVPLGFGPLQVPSNGSAHPNGGGFVADTAAVDASVYVGPEARVLETAEVVENARIEGRATVSGGARVGGQAVVKDHALVTGHAQVYGAATIYGSAQIEGGQIYGQAEVGGITWVVGETHVYENARVVSNNIERPLRSDARIYGNAQLLGDVEFSVGDISSGVWYGFIHEEFMGDPMWGADRTTPEEEVTLSITDIAWDTDFADCRYGHVGCPESTGCVWNNTRYSCVEGATTQNTFERPHRAQLQACVDGN